MKAAPGLDLRSPATSRAHMAATSCWATARWAACARPCASRSDASPASLGCDRGVVGRLAAAARGRQSTEAARDGAYVVEKTRPALRARQFAIQHRHRARQARILVLHPGLQDAGEQHGQA